MQMQTIPVAIIGAGPVGLAAAAHLLEREIGFVLIEAGREVASSMRDFAHVRLFSAWRYNIDAAIRRRLESNGWISPEPEALPTAGELVELYLEPFARLPEVQARLLVGTRVMAISRVHVDKVKSAGRESSPFLLRLLGSDGETNEVFADAVIDASGTWTSPNPVGASGLPAQGEELNRDRIRYGIPDILGAERSRYEDKTTLVLGAGHSAANSLLALAELARQSDSTQIVWAVRGKNLARAFGGGASDALPARGELGSSLQALAQSGVVRLVEEFRAYAISKDSAGGLAIHGRSPDGVTTTISGVDEIIAATGQRPDLALTRELRLQLDPLLESTEALGPLIDPNVHSCGSVRPHGHRELSHPEPGFYTIGVKSYGRAPTFLMATGYEQARSVVAAIAGDWENADQVQLNLPETGVCGVDLKKKATPAKASSCSTGTCGVGREPEGEPVGAASCCG
jgi:hypothetical protein